MRNAACHVKCENGLGPFRRVARDALLVQTIVALVTLVVPFIRATATEPVPDWPLVLEENFEAGADRWEPTDPAAWRLASGRGGQVFAQVAQSKYNPPYRSPLNVALAKDSDVTDFALDVDVKSTCPDYGHRDACLVFGYQDAAHFYYVHLGKQTDDHANQIFIVDGAPRTKISERTTEGTPWNDRWHHVRIVRRAEEGTIRVFFDDLDQPVMTATDRKFTHGRIGIGTFDDTAEYDDVRLTGKRP